MDCSRERLKICLRIFSKIIIINKNIYICVRARVWNLNFVFTFRLSDQAQTIHALTLYFRLESENE